MGLIQWLADKLNGKPVPTNPDRGLVMEYADIFNDIYIRELAFRSSVNLIANAVSKCEFRTFQDNKPVKKKEYYLWNVEPNQNQNSSVFIHKWISQLYQNNECLIIIDADNPTHRLYVADSYEKVPYTLLEDEFKNVQVGDITYRRTFQQSEVLYFTLNSVDVKRLLDGIFTSYSKLISYSMRSYQKSKGIKGIFKYNAIPTNDTEREAFNDLINNRFKGWLNADSAVLPLGNGQDWKDVGGGARETSRDIRALIDDVMDFTAKALNIPSVILRGDIAGISDALDQFLTFCIDPLLDMLQEEIIRKRYGYADYEKGNYLQIDSNSIKHVDLLSVSNAVDKLIASGAFTINDIRRVTGEPPINELFANEHFMTKNYQTMTEALQQLGGGDNG